jgi:hypothetical protein
MKLLNILTLNVFLLGGLTISTCNQAKAGEIPQNQKAKEISAEIKTKITFPDELVGKNLNEKVLVEFKIKEDKSLELVSIITQNSILKSHVKKQIENMNITNSDEFVGKTMQISLLFEN